MGLVDRVATHLLWAAEEFVVAFAAVVVGVAAVVEGTLEEPAVAQVEGPLVAEVAHIENC